MPKLLLADSSPVSRRILEVAFVRDGMQVVTVADGSGVLDALRIDRPDVVIAERALPGRDGYEVAACVKHDLQLTGVPVVLIAGAFEPVDRERARRAGCDDVFVKPFDPLRIVARVRELIARGPAHDAHADDYFERLGAALEGRARVRPRDGQAPDAPSGSEEGTVPTLDSILDRHRE